jgi:hypothetical protein
MGRDLTCKASQRPGSLMAISVVVIVMMGIAVIAPSKPIFDRGSLRNGRYHFVSKSPIRQLVSINTRVVRVAERSRYL